MNALGIVCTVIGGWLAGGVPGQEGWVESYSLAPGMGPHAGFVTFSPDGKFLAAALEDSPGPKSKHVIVLWDVTTRKKVVTLEGHKDGICCLAFSPDGRTLASGAFDNSIWLWDGAEGWPSAKGREWIRMNVEKNRNKDPKRQFSDGIDSLAFSPSGETLAWCWANDATVRITRVSNREEVAVLDTEGAGGSLAYLPKGNQLAVGVAMPPKRKGGAQVQFWDPATSTKQATLQTDFHGGIKLALARNGKWLVSAVVKTPLPMEIKLWEIATGRSFLLERSKVVGPAVAFSLDSRTLAIGTVMQPPQVILWDLATRQARGKLMASSGVWVSSLAYSPDGQYLAAGLCDSKDPVYLWRIGASQSSDKAEDRELRRKASGQ